MAGTVNNEEIQKRFVREISVAQKLKHDNVVNYFECELHEDVLFYTMELVPWGSLADVLKRKFVLDWREAVECAIHICQGLQHLHAHGVIHRDLKPANIFLSDDGRLKLGDFGLARDLGATRLTVEGHTVGTAKYLAPEQAMAKADIDGRTDLYAVGCILFEMLAGRPPFMGRQQDAVANFMDLMGQHVEDPPPRIRDFSPNCPAALDALIDRLLEKKAESRPISAAAVEIELQEILQDPERQPVQPGTADPMIRDEAMAPPLSLTERLMTGVPQRTLNKNVLIALLLVAVLIIVIVAIANNS
jgi:serine/threonine protein kinase